MPEDRLNEARMIDFEKRIRGLNHQLNRAYADLEDQYKARKTMEERLVRIEDELRNQLETIGELGNRLASLEDWKTRLRAYLNEALPKKAGTHDQTQD